MLQNYSPQSMMNTMEPIPPKKTVFNKPVLYLEDWNDSFGRANAIPHIERYAGHTTRNTSFLRFALLLKKMNVRNNMFHLALHHKELAKYDPHNLTDNSTELKYMIIDECEINPWYAIRECFGVPALGGNPTPISAKRNNISMAWCFFNNLHYYSICPRQTGKTIMAIILSCYVIYLQCYNMKVGMIGQNAKLVQENVSRLKQFRDTLPQYLLVHQTNDIDNKQGLSYEARENHFLTFVGQNDKVAADRIVRGYTFPILWWDEKSFTPNAEIMHDAVMPAVSTAAEIAATNGMPHSNIYTTTAGYLHTDEGRWTYERVCKAMPFSETLYDSANKDELHRIVRANSLNGTVQATYSYLQLGFSHEWFLERANNQSDPDKVAREYLNEWRAGVSAEVSAIDPKLVEKMRLYEKEPSYIQRVGDYVIKWYEPKSVVESSSFANNPMILTADTSEGVGNDFTSLTFINTRTGQIVGTCRCNEFNVNSISIFIANLLIKYGRTVLMPERKSTGKSIVDTIISIFRQYNINPFKRIFNQIVQDKGTERFKNVDISSTDVIQSLNYHKYLGFVTNKSSRQFLYKEVLTKAVTLNFDKIYDSTLIMELATLEKDVSGRVDHKNGNHDDMAFSYVLGFWLLFEGRNLHEYGFSQDEILSDVRSKSGYDRDYINHQLALRQKIQNLQTLMDRADNLTMKHAYARAIADLQIQIDEDITVEPITQSQVTSTLNDFGNVFPGSPQNTPLPKFDTNNLVDTIGRMTAPVLGGFV